MSFKRCIDSTSDFRPSYSNPLPYNTHLKSTQLYVCSTDSIIQFINTICKQQLTLHNASVKRVLPVKARVHYTPDNASKPQQY